MREIRQELKLVLLLLGLALYLTFLFANFTYADPQGATVSNLSSESYSVDPGSRTDDGGTITTVTLDVVFQDNSWKAYVGNITGNLVLRNTDGWSIFEWALNDSDLTGNVYVSRGNVTWSNLKCANRTIIESEQSSFGMSNDDSDSINKTFNYTVHKDINTTIGGVGTIENSTCWSTATRVNGTKQEQTESSYFQEVLLYDNSNLVYATHVYQDTWGYDNNASLNDTKYDFQIILATNATGTLYYFYAEIS